MFMKLDVYQLSGVRLKRGAAISELGCRPSFIKVGGFLLKVGVRSNYSIKRLSKRCWRLDLKMLKSIDVNESQKLSARIEISFYFRFCSKLMTVVARSYLVVVPMIILNTVLLSVCGCHLAWLVSVLP